MNESYLIRPIFLFENEDLTYALDDVMARYQWIGFLCGVVYIFLVFGIRRSMKNRTACRLRIFVIFWNSFLTFLNTLASIRIASFLILLSVHTSFYESICLDRTFLRDPVCGFWIRIFPYVKIIELGDTILLVLQKRTLVTYYWAHHLGALVITWYLYPFYPSAAPWLSLIINVFHVPVYLYGTVRSFGIRLPRVFPACLLFMEIVHMAVSIIFCCFMYSHHFLREQLGCNMTIFNVTLLLSMYTLCFILSILLFYNRFMTKSKSAGMPSSSTSVSLSTVVTKI